MAEEGLTVVLVREAMQMRREVPAPADGAVKDVRVREGTNVRPRKPRLFREPGGFAPPRR